MDLGLVRRHFRGLAEQTLGCRVVAARVRCLAGFVEVGPARSYAGYEDRGEREPTQGTHANLFSARNAGRTRKSWRNRSIGSPSWSIRSSATFPRKRPASTK